MSPLYTWRDVERLLRAQEAPPWLEIAADLEALHVTCAPGRRAEVAHRLGEIFGPYLSSDGTMLDLESTREAPRRLRVEIGESDEDTAPWPRVIRPLWPDAEQAPGLVEPLPEGSPRLAAFYSYKGGVGRTTTLLATLGALLDRRPRGARVLVVDADLEAPGLTFDIAGPPDRFCLLDFLALVHDADDWTGVIPLAAERLRWNIEGVELRSGRTTFYFLPAHRDLPDDQLFDQPVSMEQVVRGPGRAHVIAAALAALGKAIGVDVVLIDLRAGVTEMASPLLLDPRVQTFLVTSCTGQSISGTIRVLRRMATRARLETSPEVVLTMIPTTFGVESIASLTGRLKAAIPSTATDGTGEDVAEEAAQRNVHEVSFAEALIHFDSIHELLGSLLPTTDLGQRAAPRLAELLAPRAVEVPEEPPRPVRGIMVSVTAETIERAEANVQRGFLVTPVIETLVETIPAQLPATVVVGAKGAGKTFTWGQMVLAENWWEFGRAAGVSIQDKRAPVPLIFPLLGSRRLGELLVERVTHAEETVWKAIQTGEMRSDSPMTRDALFDAIERWPGSFSDVLEVWTRWIAARLGLPAAAGAGVEAIEAALRERGLGVCLAVDGLEDAFQGSGTQVDNEKRRLLHGLLRVLTMEIERLRSVHLGVVTFVRSDLAQATLGSSSNQVEAGFDKLTLSWSPIEALRLVAWLLGRAGLHVVAEHRVALASYEELRDKLKAFWGERLRSSRASEPDRWVILALSDFQGRIQARDAVRFIRVATEDIFEEAKPSPRALAAALLKCSAMKVEELGAEIPLLASIFTRMRDSPQSRRQIPFRAADFTLSPDEIALLETHGVVAHAGSGVLFMPDIFRLGLGFRVDARGRAKLLALYRAAQPKHA